MAQRIDMSLEALQQEHYQQFGSLLMRSDAMLAATSNAYRLCEFCIGLETVATDLIMNSRQSLGAVTPNAISYTKAKRVASDVLV